MKNRLIILTAAAMLLTTGCSLSDVEISKQEITEPTYRQPQAITEEASVSGGGDAEPTEEILEIPYSEVPETAELGERFCVIDTVNSGHFYLTLNRCEVFDSLNDAGLKREELAGNLIVPDLNYDPDTTKFLNNFKLIMIYMTVENVDAVSIEHVYFPEEFGKYDFSLDRMGSVRYASHEYLNLRSDDIYHYSKMHIEPGEKKDIIMGYLLDTRQASLSEAVFSNGEELLTVGPFTVVDLQLQE